MKAQRVLIVLTVVNFMLLLSLLTQAHSTFAQDGAQVLRGRALQIVDERGRVRASISVLPAVTMDGKMYPETTLLRLIDPRGRPGVKLGTSVQGAGLGLAGDSDPTYIQLMTEGGSTQLRMTDADGRVHQFKP
jgi:hypothetical protein